MAVVNTGIVLRTITGVHDANFVHPIGDEEVVNGGFDDASGWIKTGEATISGGYGNIISTTGASSELKQTILQIGVTYKYSVEVVSISYGGIQIFNGSTLQIATSIGTYTGTFVATNVQFRLIRNGVTNGSIDNISVKEVLVNRESTATNTGIVERSIVGFNDSDIPVWKGSESTSVVNNTGIVERPITGVNESDPMFPDNTISNIVNIAGLVSSLIADLKARATTFENEDATKEILINLQNC